VEEMRTVPIALGMAVSELPRVVEYELADVEDQRYQYTCDVCGQSTISDGHRYPMADREVLINVCRRCEILNELI